MKLRDKIFAAKRPTSVVNVEEWGVEVGIRMLSINERVELYHAVSDAEIAFQAYEADQALPEAERTGVKKVERFSYEDLCLMASIVDPETDERQFAVEDYSRFRDLGKVTLQRLMVTFLELNLYRDQKTSEDLKKTSGETTSDDSSSS